MSISLFLMIGFTVVMLLTWGLLLIFHTPEKEDDVIDNLFLMFGVVSLLVVAIKISTILGFIVSVCLLSASVWVCYQDRARVRMVETLKDKLKKLNDVLNQKEV